MKLVYSYKKLNLELLDMIEKADKYIYIFSWNFNIHYNRKIEEAIIHATQRGTNVYLMTGGVEDKPICMKKLKGINETFFHLKYKFQIGPKRDANILQTVFNVMPNANRQFYNHMRFALNEQTFLLGGVNSSLKYNGNLKRNMNQKNPFCWYDSGLKMSATPKMETFINNLFSNMSYDMERKSLPLPNNSRLVHDNYEAYQEIIAAIRGSKNQIYIENQYFMSRVGYTHNELAYELGERINHAIKSGENDFRVQLILNYRNYDDGNSVQITLYSMCIYSLHYMRSLVDCDDETFYKHVSIWMPRDDIDIKCIIHSKLFVVDDIFCLYTSANIQDVSFSRNGNMELGFLTKCPETVSSLYNQAIRHLKKGVFFKFHIDYADPITTIMKIPEVIDFLFSSDSRELYLDRNCADIIYAINNYIGSPLCKLLTGKCSLQSSGVLLPLT